MHFDVPKFVRSPGCDHGHDEESRNGRDIKIDILEGYIRAPEGFRGSPDKYRSTRRLPKPPRGGGVNGPYGPYGPNVEKRKGLPGQAARPLSP